MQLAAVILLHPYNWHQEAGAQTLDSVTAVDVHRIEPVYQLFTQISIIPTAGKCVFPT